jgi:hypothetical protein
MRSIRTLLVSCLVTLAMLFGSAPQATASILFEPLPIISCSKPEEAKNIGFWTSFFSEDEGVPIAYLEGILYLNPSCTWIDGGMSAGSTYVEGFFGISGDKMDVRSFHFDGKVEYIATPTHELHL